MSAGYFDAKKKNEKKCDFLFVVSKNAVPLQSQIGNESLAQLVEQQTLNLWVQGSIPWRFTREEAYQSVSLFFVTVFRGAECWYLPVAVVRYSGH